jgi:hypothetical protein
MLCYVMSCYVMSCYVCDVMLCDVMLCYVMFSDLILHCRTESRNRPHPLLNLILEGSRMRPISSLPLLTSYHLVSIV